MSTLPPTDVSKYQDEIMYPSGVYENFPEGLPSTEDNGDLTLWIYSSLIHLRVILNGAHNTLYGASKSSSLLLRILTYKSKKGELHQATTVAI